MQDLNLIIRGFVFLFLIVLTPLKINREKQGSQKQRKDREFVSFFFLLFCEEIEESPEWS